RFATLGDVAGGSRGGDSGGEGSDGEEQSFFVGGSEHSGQQVVGPKSKRNERETADELFKAARDAGAEVSSEAAARDDSSPSLFSGGGYRLGDNVGGTARVDSAPPPEPTLVPVTMTAYENGFTLDDGELRAFNDPANAAFLNDIARGRIPRELTLLHPGKEIDMKMVRTGGTYEAPKVRLFGGSGARLGAVVPEVVSSTPAKSKEESESAIKKAQAAISVDETKPVTQVQVRLPDGNRLVARLNESATVSDLRAFIATAHPSLAFAPFELRTSFPNALIADETATLMGASLLNSVVLVKMTS
ncbi:hypothetical protein PFISCL1PPCAC_15552, partial [Pristionchus fissidentatus]